MSLYFPSPEDCGHHTIFPGVNITTCSCEKMMMSYVELQPHSTVAEHSHPHEQVGIILEGELHLFIGNEDKVLRPGEMYRIPGNVKHRAVTLDQLVKALDVFTPIREEYR